MVSVVNDSSEFKTAEDFQRRWTSEEDDKTEKENSDIYKNYISVLNEQNSELNEPNLDNRDCHRAGDITDDSVISFSIVGQYNPDKNSEDTELKESDLAYLPLADDIRFPLVDIIANIFIMIEVQCNLLSNTFCHLLDAFQENSSKRVLKLIVILIGFVIIFVQSRKSTVHHTYETQRFFSRHSLVTDYYHGELSLLRQELFMSDITFVFYYAPWDRQSQDFKSHFLKAAAYHHEQITFAAINCWFPEGECRSHYKFHHYPILVVHVRIPSTTDTLNVPYNGALDAHCIIRFLNSILKPIVHISSQADLLALQLDYQVVVLGYYDVGSFSPDYVAFYYAAVRKFQYEHMNEVTYAIITNKLLAQTFLFSHVSSMHLVMWNSSVIFPPHVEMNPRNITEFVNRHMSQVTKWLHIDGRKSASLHNIIRDGPTLMVMTPDNPYHQSNDLNRLLRSVSLEYFNCFHSARLHWLSDHLNLKARAQLRESDQICRKYLKNHLYFESTLLNSLQDHDLLEWSSGTDEAFHQFSSSGFCPFGAQTIISQISWNSLLSYIYGQPLINSEHCIQTSRSSPSRSDCSFRTKNESATAKPLQDKKKDWDTVSVKNVGGPKEDETIRRLSDGLSEDHCKRLVLGSAFFPPPVIKDEDSGVKISGLSCMTNRTLKFVAVDSILHHDFASQLGVNLRSKDPKQTGAVIIDPAAEERYVLNQPLSRGVLASFVYNYTYNLLNRSKLSSSSVVIHRGCSHGEICMVDLNTHSYEEVIQQPHQTYVIFHYTHNCGACSAITHMLLSCMHVTSDIQSLKFARIDVSKNTLPWHLTFDRVPAIIVYPADKKSDSRVFDLTSPMSIQSLLLLISYGLNPSDRLKVAMKVCGETCQQMINNQSILSIRKLQQDISDVYSRYQRNIKSLVETKSHIKRENSSLLRTKYELLLNLNLFLNRKLQNMKMRQTHLQTLQNYDPKVPPEFSTLLSYETFLFTDHSNVS